MVNSYVVLPARLVHVVCSLWSKRLLEGSVAQGRCGHRRSSTTHYLYYRQVATALATGTRIGHGRAHTEVPVMFGKPILNNVLSFDHAQLQK